MSRGYSKSERKKPDRRYRRLYILVCEGAVTEPQYFDWLARLYDRRAVSIQVKKRKPGRSSPTHLIKEADSLRNSSFKKGDELWIILDKDQWTDEHFDDLLRWQERHPRNHLAVSNPKFEYWLLLHEGEHANLSVREVNDKYKAWMGEGKGIRESALSEEALASAVARAKAKHANSRKPIPKACGSTVFQLIEHIEGFINGQTGK